MPSDDRNLQDVNERPAAAKDAFLQFKGAHMNYASTGANEEDKLKCDECFTREEKKFNHFLSDDMRMDFKSRREYRSCIPSSGF